MHFLLIAGVLWALLCFATLLIKHGFPGLDVTIRWYMLTLYINTGALDRQDKCYLHSHKLQYATGKKDRLVLFT